MFGTIKLGKNTEKHQQTLETLGYVVSKTEEGIAVEVTKAIDTEFTATKANLKQLIADKQCLTYKTKIAFEDGTVRSSILACTKLGVLSCLIMKVEGEKKAKSTTALFDIDDILG